MNPAEQVGVVEPISRASWEREFAAGRWDYLAGGAEQIRYQALARLVRAHGPAPSLLDVGCGNLLLYQALGSADFAGGYVGVDWAITALPAGNLGPRHHVVCADARHLPIRGRFDVVVCTEVLYYLAEPGRIVADLLGRLTEHGRMLISLFRPVPEKRPAWHGRIKGLEEELARHPALTERHVLTDPPSGRTWCLQILQRGCVR